MSGRVVDAVSGLPIAGVEVTARDAHRRGMLSARTDSDGHFQIRLPGMTDVFLSATKAGYLRGEFGEAAPGEARQVLRPGERGAAPPVLRLWKAGVVTGRVVDGHGEPLVDVSIAVLRYGVEGGHERLLPFRSRSGRTDDRGEYRFAGLQPGLYTAAAEPMPTRRPDDTWATTYAPGTIDSSFARLVNLDAGQVVEALDIVVQHQVSGLAIAGEILNPDQGLPLTVELLPGGLGSERISPLPLATAAVDEHGRFRFHNIGAGAYELRASVFPDMADGRPLQTSRRVMFPAEPSTRIAAPGTVTLWARAEVHVRDRDVDVPITLTAAGKLVGNVTGLPGAAGRSDRARFPPLYVMAIPRDAGAFGTGAAELAEVKPTGEFETAGLVPGQYTLALVADPTEPSPDTYVKAVSVGGRTTEGPTVDVPASGVSRLTILAADDVGTIEGTIRTSRGLPVADATVYVFPQNRAYWSDYGPLPRRLKAVRTAEDGSYRAEGVPPGEYLLHATLEAPGATWRLTSELERLSRGAEQSGVSARAIARVDLVVGGR